MSTDPIPPNSTQPDPSMEDILASIRRILDEEGTKPAEPEPVATAPETPVDTPAVPAADTAPDPWTEVETPDAGDDVLDLDDSMMLPEEPDADAPGPVPSPPPILADPVAAPPEPSKPEPAPVPLPVPLPLAMAPLPSSPALAPSRPAPAEPLVAPAAAAAAMSVGTLLRTLASERTTAVHRGGPTIEDLVREEMRPLLKEWLDTHLPPLVERLVRAEIERVVNRMA